jgi:hypothetical protein
MRRELTSHKEGKKLYNKRGLFILLIVKSTMAKFENRNITVGEKNNKSPKNTLCNFTII